MIPQALPPAQCRSAHDPPLRLSAAYKAERNKSSTLTERVCHSPAPTQKSHALANLICSPCPRMPGVPALCPFTLGALSTSRICLLSSPRSRSVRMEARLSGSPRLGFSVFPDPHWVERLTPPSCSPLSHHTYF